MRFNPLFLFFSLFIFPFIASAQYLEAGVAGGGTFYQGDLQTEFANNAQVRPAFGMFVRYNAHPNLSCKFQVLKGEIAATDNKNSAGTNLYMRNLSFRSTILEASAVMEWNIGGYDIRAGKMTCPYFFAGLNGFYFNPEAQLRGVWHELQPLGTEGQGLAEYPDRKKYNRFQVAVPMGLGFKFALDERTNVGVEFGIRKTFTDYLDDVSGNAYPNLAKLKEQNPTAAQFSYRSLEIDPKGNSNPTGVRGTDTKKDLYFFIGFNISVNLANKYKLEFDPRYQLYPGKNH
jgi:Domain of unknown function (DUF6089)